MVEKVKSKKIPGKAAGRAGYSRDIEVSTIPYVRKHQLRMAAGGRLTPPYPIPPGKNTGTLFAIPLPAWYRQPGGVTTQWRKFHVVLSEKHLWKFKIGRGNLDRALEGYPPGDYINRYIYKGYSYGDMEVKIDKGFSFFIPEDEPVSDYYPDYLKHCLFVLAWNITDKELQPTFTMTATGFVSRKAK